jgi:large subunit ribosomal protein LP2
MKHLAAYALCVLGGNAEPSAADVEKVLKEAGAKVDADVLAKLVEQLKGKQLHEVSFCYL